VTRSLLLPDVHSAWGSADDLIDHARRKEGPFDRIIQLGDMGFGFAGVKPWKTKYEEILWFIDGNHDNHEMLSNRGDPNFGYDPYHVLWPREWQDFLKRWEYKERGAFEDGILFIGGASSIDRIWRTAGKDWWPGENISYEDEERVMDTIEEVGAENIHTVISHDCPAGFSMAKPLRIHNGSGAKENFDNNRKFLEHVRTVVKPERWYFGHYHFNWSGEIDGCKWQCIDMVRGNGKYDYAVLET
jgi:hypothetical protein